MPDLKPHRLSLLYYEPIAAQVLNERHRAHRKHGVNGSMEHRWWADPMWLPVLVEEVGEVARLLCDRALRTTEEHPAQETADRHQLRAELIQVAAMATAWIAALDEEEQP